MSDRRNPYLILGIDHGADADQASAAFARATRRVRGNPDAPYTVEDLTWALHSVEQTESDSDASFDSFRVPADPTAYLDGSGTEELLPPEVLRSTAHQGDGWQELEDKALLAELQQELVTATEQHLERSEVKPAPPVTPKVPPPPAPPEADKPASAGSPTAVSRPTSKSGRQPWIIAAWIVVVGAILAVWIGAELASNSESAPDPDATESTEDLDRDLESAFEPDPEPESGAWVSEGDCLAFVGNGNWEPTACGGHDAEVIGAIRSATDGNRCPGYTDVWFDDGWGVYCTWIVSDQTPEGGHWGIGPVHAGTCLGIDTQGNLRGKAPCGGVNVVPVHNVASTPEGCESVALSGDYFTYWPAIDGTSNYLCVDGFHWDREGLP